MQNHTLCLLFFSIITLLSCVSAIEQRQYPPDPTQLIADLKNIRRDSIELPFDLTSFLTEPCTEAAGFTDDFVNLLWALNKIPADVVAGAPWDDIWSKTAASLAQGYTGDATTLLSTLIANVSSPSDGNILNY